MRGADGLALGSVGGGGERELDMLTDVLGRERALPGTAGDEQAAVLADPRDARGVTVGDAKVAVIASGGNSVAETDPLTTARDGLTSPLASLFTGLLTGAVAVVLDGCVERCDLVAGVGEYELLTLPGTGGADGGQGGDAFHLTGVKDDLAAFVEGV